jgi:hypothetical protein
MAASCLLSYYATCKTGRATLTGLLRVVAIDALAFGFGICRILLAEFPPISRVPGVSVQLRIKQAHVVGYDRRPDLLAGVEAIQAAHPEEEGGRACLVRRVRPHGLISTMQLRCLTEATFCSNWNAIATVASAEDVTPTQPHFSSYRRSLHSTTRLCQCACGPSTVGSSASPRPSHLALLRTSAAPNVNSSEFPRIHRLP